MRKVYVVSIPWDSASVDRTYVFSRRKRAEQFLEAQEARGYHGYTNGLQVEDCVIDTSKGE
jgi:hypothetical protein